MPCNLDAIANEIVVEEPVRVAHLDSYSGSQRCVGRLPLKPVARTLRGTEDEGFEVVAMWTGCMRLSGALAGGECAISAWCGQSDSPLPAAGTAAGQASRSDAEELLGMEFKDPGRGREAEGRT